MQFDFGGAQQLLAYLNGKIPLRQALDHPSYKAIFRHARMFGNGITTRDVENALAGKPSPFFGTESLKDNLPHITALLNLLGERQAEWCAIIEAELLY